MSQKDYVKFANMLRAALEDAPELKGEVVVSRIANQMADIFQADNPNFRRGTFLAFAGL